MLSWNKVPNILLSRSWWWRSLIVLCVMGVMARLGIWQLERHFQRRARNEFVTSQLSYPSVLVDALYLQGNTDTIDMRSVTVMGEFDYEKEFILREQLLRGKSGVNLITPLMLYNSDKAVLVNRGWVPHQFIESGNVSKFHQYGQLNVSGRIRKSQDNPAGPLVLDGSLREIYHLDIDDLQGYVDYTLVPVYLQEELGNESFDTLPQSVPLQFEITDGPHLGYALQWWLFVPLLGWVYLHLVRTSEGRIIVEIDEDQNLR
ncbi:MAG: hypothetical protein CL789_01300 [Chloroflexi bacterium]|nr:hypothetical protein [Chloroflexota bacterium]